MDHTHRRALHRRGIIPKWLEARFSPTAVFPSSTPTAVTPSDSASSAASVTPTNTVATPATLAAASTSNSVPVVTPVTTLGLDDTATTTSVTSTTPSATSTTSSATSTLVTTPSSSTTASATSVPTTALPTVLITSHVATTSQTSTTVHLGSSSIYSTHTSSNINSLSSGSAAAAGASESASSSDSSVHTPAIVGGILAAVVGIAGIVFAVTYLIRRARNKGEETEDFDPAAFRRKSVMISEGDNGGAPARSMSYNRGNNDGPGPYPSMVEQHYPDMPPSTFGNPDAAYGNTSVDPNMVYTNPNDIYHEYNRHPYASGQAVFSASPMTPTFFPGQIVPRSMMSPPPSAMTMSPNSTNPFITSFDTPTGSPVIGPYDVQQGYVGRQPSVGSSFVPAQYDYNQAMLPRSPPPVVTRKNSMPQTPMNYESPVRQYSGSEFMTRQSSDGPLDIPPTPSDGEYIDLSRSSVTAFQAAQYVEISRQLNAAPPVPLLSAALTTVTEETTGHATLPIPENNSTNTRPLDLGQTVDFESLTVPPGKVEHSLPDSPFADPHFQAQQERPLRQVNPGSEEQSVVRASAYSDMTGETGESGETFMIRDSFPNPPSPAMMTAPRVQSTPPILPEIHIQQRAFSPVSYEFPLEPASPRPSPLATSFTLPVQSADDRFPTSPAPTQYSFETVRAAPARQRPETVYDDEDAYAAI